MNRPIRGRRRQERQRSTQTVKGIDIAIVEVEGPFAGGMGTDG